MPASPSPRRVAELFAGLSIADNLALGSYRARRRTSDEDASNEDLLDWVFELFPVLGERRRQLAGTLSGGEQQMLAMSRAMMARPKLLLLDEPSLGLAPVMVERIVSAIERIRQELQTSVLMVEQNIGAAAALADRIVVLSAGRTVAQLDADDGFDVDQLEDLYWGGGAEQTPG